MNEITEKTLIPLSLLGTIVGGVVWLSVIYYKTEATAASVHKLENRLEILQDKIVYQNEKILEKVTRLETKLDAND